MGLLRRFGAFWWDFIVGDDPITALGIALGIAGTALLAHRQIASWWLLPAVAGAVTARFLIRSVRRATAQARSAPREHG